MEALDKVPVSPFVRSTFEGDGGPGDGVLLFRADVADERLHQGLPGGTAPGTAPDKPGRQDRPARNVCDL